MKKTLLLSIALLLNGLSLFAQWEWQNPLPQGNKLNSVCFPDANTGYAVGDAGTIIKTIDAGTTWTSLSSGTTINLLSVYFTDANTGYAVGSFVDFYINYCIIIKTINGGSNWTSLSSGVLNYLSSVYFTNTDTGYIAGGLYYNGAPQGADILKTVDGGINWTGLPVPPAPNTYNSIFFADVNTGYAIFALGYIIKTTDAGATWIFLSTGTINDLYSIYFTDAYIGYAVGNSGTIVKTINGGTTWINQSSGTTTNLNSVCFTDANTGYVVGSSGTILKTINGGTTWITQSSGTTNGLRAAYFTEADTGFVVGDGGTILKTTNGGVPPVGLNEKPGTNSLKIFPNPVKEKLIIEMSEPGSNMNGTVSIYGMAGQKLISQKVQGTKVEVNVTSLPTGIYFIRLMNSEKNGFGHFVKE